ncbi:hypothetical protein AERO9AM_10374 [Aeromicrobium sp. 9AM]|nr:hypothetical protein AERO9AM_10374 [Aeromicrobium sp. 9AM]
MISGPSCRSRASIGIRQRKGAALYGSRRLRFSEFGTYEWLTPRCDSISCAVSRSELSTPSRAESESSRSAGAAIASAAITSLE